ncbi:GtrA family protein [Glycomyces sp. NPDC046736]|uniref:GtrA family protein n=1 Tax=Glycomyces sp. NPDC046736 TaxID=3155615 RepID=UPI0033E812B5
MRLPPLSRLVRFAAVGLVCFAIQAALLVALHGAGTPQTLANAVGFLASAQVNFLLSTYFTWRDRRLPRLRRKALAARWVAFQTTVAVSLACNTAVFALVSQFAPPVAAAAVGVGAGALLTYLASDHLIFRRRAADPELFGDSLDDHRRTAAAVPGPARATADD